jgi:hypothetical protein
MFLTSWRINRVNIVKVWAGEGETPFFQRNYFYNQKRKEQEFYEAYLVGWGKALPPLS